LTKVPEAVPAPLSAEDVYDALRKRYKEPEYILLREVRNQTGYQDPNTSYADAMAFSTWPSRGMEILGMEIKASRSDWLREKKNPKKAESLFRFCNAWYLVTPEGVRIEPGELPSSYGHLVVKKRGVTVAKEAPPQTPLDPSRAFLMSCLRNASSRSASKAELNAAVRGANADAEKFWKAHYEEFQAIHERRLAQLEKTIADFETASGIRLGGWTGGTELGDAVKTVLRGGLTQVMNAVERAKDDLQRQVHVLENFIKANDELAKKRPTRAAIEPHAGDDAQDQIPSA
jgi:hypothetical protein